MLQVAVFKVTKKITRKKEGFRLFKCAPAHHHFEACGWSEVKVVSVFSVITFLLCALAWVGLYF